MSDQLSDYASGAAVRKMRSMASAALDQDRPDLLAVDRFGRGGPAVPDQAGDALYQQRQENRQEGQRQEQDHGRLAVAHLVRVSFDQHDRPVEAYVVTLPGDRHILRYVVDAG